MRFPRWRVSRIGPQKRDPRFSGLALLRVQNRRVTHPAPNVGEILNLSGSGRLTGYPSFTRFSGVPEDFEAKIRQREVSPAIRPRRHC